MRFRLGVWRLLQLLPEFTLTVRTRHGKLSIRSHDAIVGSLLFVGGEFDYAPMGRAVGLARELGQIGPAHNGLLLDVGANIGTTCIPLVRQGVFDGAVAVEPEPRNHALLQRNVRLNRLERQIRTFQYAISATAGDLKLELAERNFGDHRIRMGPTTGLADEFGEGRRAVVRVPALTLDGLLARAGVPPTAIGLLWIDVQGHEEHVLRGAGDLLSTRVPVVMECWPYGLARAGTRIQALADVLGVTHDTVFDLAEEHPRGSRLADLPSLLDRYDGIRHTDVLVIQRARRASARR